MKVYLSKTEPLLFSTGRQDDRGSLRGEVRQDDKRDPLRIMVVFYGFSGTKTYLANDSCPWQYHQYQM